MDASVNAAEQFVSRICLHSFLSLWCYRNPRAQDGKELCDVLVVCEPHVIIVSVKDVHLKSPERVDVERWHRRAIEGSIKQIYGAERALSLAGHVIHSDGTRGVPLPGPGGRVVHRIAVACGGNGQVAITSGDRGKGFVHVMDEQSFLEALRELDTVTDLVDYLAAKESFAGSAKLVVEGGESNLVALYLINQRRFPTEYDHVVVNDGLWTELAARPEFQRRRAADVDSYIWDRLIEALSDPQAKTLNESTGELSDLEQTLRAMAKETRFSRRILGQGVGEFLKQARAGRTRSRLLVGASGVIYVLVSFDPEDDAKYRRAELGNRCFAGRHAVGAGDTVVGIGIGQHAPGVGSTTDTVFLHLPNWTAEDDAHAAAMRAALGYFTTVPLQRGHFEEFPPV